MGMLLCPNHACGLRLRHERATPPDRLRDGEAEA